MSRTVAAGVAWLVALAACGGSDASPAQDMSERLPLQVSPPAPPAATLGNPPAPASTQTAPAAAEPPASDAFAVFVDPDSGLRTTDVHDVDRQVVRFDAEQDTMVWALSGAAVSGWATDGNDLRWSSGGAFRVRFGEEAGERRAYFTEAGPGTICDLEITAPEELSISPSGELPPGR